MSSREFIDAPVDVQVRILPDERLQPAAFIWQGHTLEIADWGREWDEGHGGATWRCYLVRTADSTTFELRHNQETKQWVLARAWRRSVAG